MNLHRVGRAVVFVAGSVIGGLALAFVIVLVHPQLLQRDVAAPPATLGGTGNENSEPAVSPAAPAGGESGRATAQPAAAPEDAPHGNAIGGYGAMRGADESPTASPESYAGAVSRAEPAVVNIFTRRLVTEQVQPSMFDQLFGDLQPLYRRRIERALGSGVIVDDAGHIVTNHHVIANADVINVELSDGRTTRATVVGQDPDTDIALLSIKLAKLPVMPLGDSSKLQVGDVVLAIGNPLGLSGSGGQATVTHGIVSAKGRQQLGVATFEDFIQTDAAINAGNSGGALINARGELIGINTAVLNHNTAGDTSVEGIGFAIPVNLVRGVMKEILDHGRVIRGWIGILPEDVDDEQAGQLGLPRGGVVITNMYRASPAVDANLHIGDIVTAVDGKPVHSARDTLDMIVRKKPGSHIHLHLLRGRSALDASMQVVERPSSIRGT
jgi:serine protease DegS